MASKAEIESALKALGPLADDERVKPFIHLVDVPANTSWMDFDGIDPDTLSIGEEVMIELAEDLYRGTGTLGHVMAYVDERTWIRALEAITIRRGVLQDGGLHILPGQVV